MFNKIKLSLIAFILISSTALAENVSLVKESVMCTTVENLGRVYMASQKDELELIQWMVDGKRCVVNEKKIDAVLIMDIGESVKKIAVYSVIDGESVPLDFWTFGDYLEVR